MLKRKAYQDLLDWKQRSQGSTALLIEGARRVGKSTLVEEFGKREYASCLVIDFTFAPDDVIGFFKEMRNDLDSFFLYLSAYYQVPLHERGTLIIFDEVQAFPKARESIKQLVADGRYDYLETGSLMSIRKNVDGILLPSEERSMHLYPFDFAEFLWALKEEPLADAIKDSFERKKPLPASLHRKAMRLFREYMLVGGMPGAVKKYCETRSFADVDEVKRDILALYRNDIAKHAGATTRRVTAIFDTIASQLSKHEKRFNIASLGKHARMRDYEDAFFWLSDAHITNDCFNSTDLSIGLRINEDRATVKCYLADTGLLVTHALASSPLTADTVYRDILLEKIGLNEGMLTENIVAQQLRAHGHDLFFYSRSSREDAAQNMEIDFLIVQGYENAALRARVSPVEVKSSKRYSTASLDKLKAKFGKRIGTQYVVCPKELLVEGDRVTLPLYMAGCL